jgi:hypothetical protein
VLKKGQTARMTHKEIEEKLFEIMLYIEQEKNRYKFFRENWYNIFTIIIFCIVGAVSVYEWKTIQEHKLQTIIQNDMAQDHIIKQRSQ